MDYGLKIWKVIDVIKTTENIFKKNNIKSERLNAELLLSKVLDCSRIDLYLNFDKPLTKQEINRYKELAKRRLKKEPLQYILGKTEFYGLNFEVNSDVLIPRQETEQLVDQAISYIKNCNVNNPIILEIGTGSGCIACTLAYHTECTIDAIDINPYAIRLAKINASKIKTIGRLNFIVKDFLNEVNTFRGYDIIISNPPYISKKDYENLDEEIKNYEPYNALTDSKDGFTYYKKIFKTLNNTFKNTEKTIRVFLEISYGVKNKIEKQLKQHRINNFKFYNDLSGIPRVLEINK